MSSDARPEPVALARAEERLRQEREAFDQLKRHDSVWFWLKVAAATIACLALPGVGITAAWIVFHPTDFSEATSAIAATTLLVDLLAFSAAIYKLLIGVGPSKLDPVTQGE